MVQSVQSYLCRSCSGQRSWVQPCYTEYPVWYTELADAPIDAHPNPPAGYLSNKLANEIIRGYGPGWPLRHTRPSPKVLKGTPQLSAWRFLETPVVAPNVEGSSCFMGNLSE